MKKSLLPLLLASLLLPSVALGGGHLSKLEQFNVMVIVSTGELGFDKWLQAYEGGAEMRKKDGERVNDAAPTNPNLNSVVSTNKH